MMRRCCCNQISRSLCCAVRAEVAKGPAGSEHRCCGVVGICGSGGCRVVLLHASFEGAEVVLEFVVLYFLRSLCAILLQLRYIVKQSFEFALLLEVMKKSEKTGQR